MLSAAATLVLSVALCAEPARADERTHFQVEANAGLAPVASIRGLNDSFGEGPLLPDSVLAIGGEVSFFESGMFRGGGTLRVSWRHSGPVGPLGPSDHTRVAVDAWSAMSGFRLTMVPLHWLEFFAGVEAGPLVLHHRAASYRYAEQAITSLSMMWRGGGGVRFVLERRFFIFMLAEGVGTYDSLASSAGVNGEMHLTAGLGFRL
jgi:hypothetical protein